MNETYVELMVKRKGRRTAKLVSNILLAIGVFYLLFFFLTIMSLALISGIVLIVASVLIKNHFVVEYEYLYLDKELTIDRIRNEKRRKKIAEFPMSSLELCAPEKSKRLAEYQKRTDVKVKNFSSREDEGRIYALIIRAGGRLEQILIDVNDELLEQIKRSAPRKVFED